MIVSDIIDKIKDSNNICITFHTSPDGDAFGSALALFIALKSIGKTCYIMNNDKVPDNYQFLPFINEVLKNKLLINDTDCVVVLDCGNFERISTDDLNSLHGHFTINIDHHVSNDMYGNLNYVDSNASSTGEIVYQVIKLMGVTVEKNIAQCLYTAIVTDSGSFRYSKTTSITHQIAGDLINTGIDFPNIHRMLFENKKFQRVKLAGEIINKMYLLSEGRICIMSLTEDDLLKYDLEEGDTSDLLNYGTSIDTVEVTLLFKERANSIKVSLRSKNIVDVRKIVEKFGGGGHIRAAGLSYTGNIEDIKNALIKEVEKELE